MRDAAPGRRCREVSLGRSFGHLDDTYVQSEANRTSRCTMAQVGWMPWTLPPTASPSRLLPRLRKPSSPRPPWTGPAVGLKERGLTEKHEAAVATFGGARRGAFHGRRGAARAGHRGTRARLSDVRGDRRLPRGGRGHEGADQRLQGSPRRSRRGDRLDSRRPPPERGPERLAGRRGGPGSAEEAGDRPDGRAEPRLAAALPALDRARRPADRRRGGGAGASASSAATCPPSSR